MHFETAFKYVLNRYKLVNYELWPGTFANTAKCQAIPCHQELLFLQDARKKDIIKMNVDNC